MPIVVSRCVVTTHCGVFSSFCFRFSGISRRVLGFQIFRFSSCIFLYAYISFHSYCGKILFGLPDMINHADIDDGMVCLYLQYSHECATSVSCTILPESLLYSKIKRFMFLFSPRNVPETQISESSPQIQIFPLCHFGCWLNSKTCAYLDYGFLIFLSPFDLYLPLHISF